MIVSRRRSPPRWSQARQACAASGQPERRFGDFCYRTRDSWSRERRVVGKAEHLPGKSNPRFIVTSLPADVWPAQALYEQFYCARGEMENRIKECQLDLFADRTSTATMRANQLRLWFASLAYVMLESLRRIGLHGTALANATCASLRLKLLKIGAQVRTSVRRIHIAMASNHPHQARMAPGSGAPTPRLILSVTSRPMNDRAMLRDTASPRKPLGTSVSPVYMRFAPLAPENKPLESPPALTKPATRQLADRIIPWRTQSNRGVRNAG